MTDDKTRNQINNEAVEENDEAVGIKPVISGYDHETGATH